MNSVNEELETSKEELQSVNEELATVNAELQTKVAADAVSLSPERQPDGRLSREKAEELTARSWPRGACGSTGCISGRMASPYPSRSR